MKFLGYVGTAALLMVVVISYLIWQFNPSFTLPERKIKPEPEPKLLPEAEEGVSEEPEIAVAAETLSVNDMYAQKKNGLNGEGVMQYKPVEKPQGPEFEIIEKEEPQLVLNTPSPETAVVDELLHKEELDLIKEEEPATELFETPMPVSPPPRKMVQPIAMESLPLEIKTARSLSRKKNYRPLKKITAICRRMNPHLICAIINIRAWNCWKHMAVKKLCRIRPNWKPIKTRSSTR